MQLHDVHQGIHKRKRRKRIGRGVGSGTGKTAGKGHKGHSSRQGFKLSAVSEGGQMPLARRVPKRGFVNGAFRKHFAIINLDAIDTAFEVGAIINEAALRAIGLIKGRHDDGVKVLGDGNVTKALHISAPKFSETARQKITAAGGTVTIVKA